MATAINNLHNLARLYREGVDGAQEQLLQLARSEDVEKTLGIKGTVNFKS